MSPSTRLPVAGSSGIWPEKYTVFPARTAWEYGPMADGAFSVAMVLRVMDFPRGIDPVSLSHALRPDASWLDAFCGSRFIGEWVLASTLPAAAGSPMNRLLHLQWVAVDAADYAGAADAAHHVGEVLAVLHFDREEERGSGAVALDVFDVLDVRAGIRDGRCHRGEHARTVEHFDAKFGAVVALHVAIPLDGDDALGGLSEFDDVRALDPVHHDALARGQEADDLVARQRVTAIAEAEHAAFRTADADLLGVVLRRCLRMTTLER